MYIHTRRCTVIQMSTGTPPWEEITNKIALLFHIATTHGPPAIPEYLSQEGKDFLSKCFKVMRVCVCVCTYVRALLRVFKMFCMIQKVFESFSHIPKKFAALTIR